MPFEMAWITFARQRSPTDGREVRTRSGPRVERVDICLLRWTLVAEDIPGDSGRAESALRARKYSSSEPSPVTVDSPSPEMPVWLDFTDERGAYTLPDIENRGFKLAFDRHGPAFDPDTG